MKIEVITDTQPDGPRITLVDSLAVVAHDHLLHAIAVIELLDHDSLRWLDKQLDGVTRDLTERGVVDNFRALIARELVGEGES